MKKFQSSDTLIKFNIWFRRHPESWHPLDIGRFYDFLTALFYESDYISESELRDAIDKEKEWKDKEFINEFIEIAMFKIDELRSYFDYLKSNNVIIKK